MALLKLALAILAHLCAHKELVDRVFAAGQVCVCVGGGCGVSLLITVLSLGAVWAGGKGEAGRFFIICRSVSVLTPPLLPLPLPSPLRPWAARVPVTWGRAA